MSISVLRNHLRNQSPSVPLPTLAGALAHHLAVDQPSPTPLAAAAVSSPFFLSYPHTHDRLQGLVTAFRHAVHLKHQALLKSREDGWSFSKALFSKSVDAVVRDWARDIIRGLQGGLAVVKLACCTGLLLGLRELGQGFRIAQVENEVVISLAEVLDNYSMSAAEWEKEFWPDLDETTISLTLVLASQSLLLVPRAKLKALPLPLLIQLLISTISSAFDDGNLLNTLPTISPSFSAPTELASALTRKINRIIAKPTMHSMSVLSRMTSLLLVVVMDSPKDGLEVADQTLRTLQEVCRRVERDWVASTLSRVEKEGDLDMRELSKSIWSLFKTFLFTIIMISEGILDSIVYLRPQTVPQSVTPQTIAQRVLRSLSHLSFVISQFGGVTTMETANQPGFKELRKVFYLAIDVLCSGEKVAAVHAVETRCEAFARDLIADFRLWDGRQDIPPSVKDAKAAYTLSGIEQLVPLLQERCLSKDMWDICAPYLSDPTRRATYESAHSVILSIFASHAQRHSVGSHLANSTSDPASIGFVQKMVPLYAGCLIENSKDGHLSTSQLRLAYVTLVRGAVSCHCGIVLHINLSDLAWYCLVLLLDEIRDLSSVLDAAQVETDNPREQLHRLHLTLIETLSALPLPLMLRALEEIRAIFAEIRLNERLTGKGRDDKEQQRRKELGEALFKKLLEGVGDLEKEAAMSWWYKYREELDLDVEALCGEGRGDGSVARL